MPQAYDDALDSLSRNPRRWLLTGAAGFIGSHLLETLLRAGQQVVGLDNFSSGHQENLTAVRASVGEEKWKGFLFFEGTVADTALCEDLVERAEVVLHQAALSSVPLSIEQPADNFASNVEGFHNILLAARKHGVKRVVYASSASLYGDDPKLPKRETDTPKPLSPYGLSKQMNEQFALHYGKIYGLETVGMRYFNVYGPRQDPNNAYAAVISKWLAALCGGDQPLLFGDGSQTRDFVSVRDVVQANILAATTASPTALNKVYNVGTGAKTDLLALFDILKKAVAPGRPAAASVELKPQPLRSGDVPHSQAEIMKLRTLLQFEPSVSLSDGLTETANWYAANQERMLG